MREILFRGKAIIYDFCYKCGQALDWRETE